MNPSHAPARVIAVVAAVGLAGCTADGASVSASGTPPALAVVSASPSLHWTASAPPDSVYLVDLASVEEPDPAAGYGLGGRPDGMGIAIEDGVATLYVAHELDAAEGVARAHGERGGFVSAWTLDPSEVGVTDGRDLVTEVLYWDYAGERWSRGPTAPGGAPASAAFARICSASLATADQLFDSASGRGYNGTLFLVNEEVNGGGRVFAATASGGAYQLPLLGLFAHENTVVASGTGRTTVAVSTEDHDPGFLRIYVGEKRAGGNPADLAGLTDGVLKVLEGPEGIATDAAFREAYGVLEPARVTVSAPVNAFASAADQAVEAQATGLSFSRIEDAAFDPGDPNALYFVTTTGGGKDPDPSLPETERDGGGLWRLEFDDVRHPELGGTLTLVLRGFGWPYLDGPDNIAIDAAGNILIQEDPTSAGHYRRIVAYRIADGAVGVVTHVPLEPGDAVSALSGSTPTANYESTGIVDASGVYGPGWFLFGVQVHDASGLAESMGTDAAAAAVEKGYLYALHVPDWDAVYSAVQ